MTVRPPLTRLEQSIPPDCARVGHLVPIIDAVAVGLDARMCDSDAANRFHFRICGADGNAHSSLMQKNGNAPGRRVALNKTYATVDRSGPTRQQGEKAMSRWMRGGAVAFVAALLPAVAGVADANPVSQVKETLDGFHLTLSLDNVIQSVPNMAGAPFVREGFLSATSKLEVVCKPDTSQGATKCADVPITASLIMTAQVGCPMDISSGVRPSFQPSFGSSIPIQSFLQAIVPPPTPAPTPTPSDITDIALAPNVSLNPSASLRLDPGYIRDVGLGAIKFPTDNDLLDRLKKSIDLAGKAASIKSKPSDSTGGTSPTKRDLVDRAADVLKEAVLTKGEVKPLMLSVQNFHLEVDDHENQLAVCGGVVAVRIYAQGKIQTPTSVYTVDLCGEISTL